MSVGLTLMVRDEADIIRPLIDHYREQGIDHILVTDNGSLDGTAEILEEYARNGAIELLHDPVHRKQQSPVVTAMARQLSEKHAVDWVINTDADEFLLSKNRALSLADVFAQLPIAIRSFTVPVTNLVGPLAAEGTGIGRLVWRDRRSPEELAKVGLKAQPTHNAIHVGSPDVTVSQGNHFVSIASEGDVPAGLEMEVLHLPWRSWAQYRHRVEVSGNAYRSNPDLRPSPNHHGMIDFQRLQDGVLLAYFAARHCTAHELEFRDDFESETVLSDMLGSHPGVREDVFFDTVTSDLAQATGRGLVARDQAILETQALLSASEDQERHLREVLAQVSDNMSGLTADLRNSQAQYESLQTFTEAMQARRVVRMADSVGRLLRKNNNG